MSYNFEAEIGGWRDGKWVGGVYGKRYE